jgi:hypothetical protein
VSLCFLGGCAAAPLASTPSAFVAVYRWHVRPGCEARFVAAWEAETERYRGRWQSHGTRLYRDESGAFVATAFWPSQEAWSRAHQEAIDVSWAEAINADCIEAREPELHLQLLEDRAGAARAPTQAARDR